MKKKVVYYIEEVPVCCDQHRDEYFLEKDSNVSHVEDYYQKDTETVK